MWKLSSESSSSNSNTINKADGGIINLPTCNVDYRAKQLNDSTEVQIKQDKSTRIELNVEFTSKSTIQNDTTHINSITSPYKSDVEINNSTTNDKDQDIYESPLGLRTTESEKLFASGNTLSADINDEELFDLNNSLSDLNLSLNNEQEDN